MQFSAMPGCSTTDAISILCQLQGKFHAVNKTLYMTFMDMKKVFDCAPMRIIWWAIHKFGTEKWLVSLMQSMYENSKSRLLVSCNLNEEVIWKMNVHRGPWMAPAVHHASGSPFPDFYRMSPRKRVCRWHGYHHWIPGGTAGEAGPVKD